MVRRLLLTLVAAMTPAVAQAVWQEASSTHFVVYSDDTPEHIRDFTVRLERYDRAMHVLRGLPDNSSGRASRVTVFVVKNEAAVAHLAHDDNVAGFYQPRAEGSVAFTPRSSGDGSKTALTAQEVLFHEYAHHITFMAWGHTALPAWFVEGFAEFNATATIGPDGTMRFGLPPYYRASTMLDLNSVPIKMLLTADPNTLGPMQRQTFYGRAWLLVHYLTFDEARRHQLSEYIDRIGKGEPAMKAATVFGDTRKLDVELNRYILRPKITTLEIQPSVLTTGPVAVRPLTAAETATMPALILSKRGVSAKTAPAALAPARAAATAWPADPFVQNELAEAEYDAGHFDEARNAATRAMTADPRSVHALMYAGMARIASATKAKSSAPADWADARHFFTLANRLDPEDPWPLVMFYRSYGAAGQPATGNAQAGLLYAQQLAPFDSELGLLAAEVHLRQNKPDQARAVLMPVAFNPHGGTSATAAQSILAALDKDGASAALAIFDAKRDPPAAGKESGKGTSKSILGTST